MKTTSLTRLLLPSLLILGLTACNGGPETTDEGGATRDQVAEAPVTDGLEATAETGSEAEAPADLPTASIPADALGCAAFTEGAELQIAMHDVIKAIEDGCLKGQIQFVDARPQIDFESGHIAGSVNVPFHSPQAYFETLPKDKWLITYCECPNSEALQLANALTKDGGFSKVKYIAEGLAAWRDFGRELVEGAEPGTGDY